MVLFDPKNIEVYGVSNRCQHLDKDEKRRVWSRDSEYRALFAGQYKVPSMTLISESGLYKLIMRSDKPQAKPFQDWVTKVVLPAIRKDGGYIAGEEKVATGEISDGNAGTKRTPPPGIFQKNLWSQYVYTENSNLPRWGWGRRWTILYRVRAFACGPPSGTPKGQIGTRGRAESQGNQGFLRISGAPGRTRTADPLITNQVLYQLSYKGAGAMPTIIGAGCKPFAASPTRLARLTPGRSREDARKRRGAPPTSPRRLSGNRCRRR